MFCRNTAVVPAAYGAEYGVMGVAGGSYLRHSVGPITAHSVRDKCCSFYSTPCPSSLYRMQSCVIYMQYTKLAMFAAC